MDEVSRPAPEQTARVLEERERLIRSIFKRGPEFLLSVVKDTALCFKIAGIEVETDGNGFHEFKLRFCEIAKKAGQEEK